MNLLISIALCLVMLPTSALAQSIAPLVKDPLGYSLRQYGFILTVSLLGGFVRWYRKVQKGEAHANLAAMIGELATSAFAGLMAFWICEAFNVSALLTACAAGLAGHAGGQGVEWLERIARKRAERFAGVSSTGPAPLRRD